MHGSPTHTDVSMAPQSIGHMSETKSSWTNRSIRALAGSSDPIQVITARARALVFKAAERGWNGPPFNPFQLAELLGVPLVPREDLHDARLVPLGSDRVQIEYNPSRPPERVRFTIAHELA